MARAYVVLNAKAGQAPVELGIALDEGALQGLPMGAPMGAASHGGHGAAKGPMKHAAGNILVLRLPAQSPAPYRFAQLDWNPQGHPPAGVYGAPHFDFHFYRTSIAARDAISPADPQRFAAEARNLPTGDFVPAGYIVPGDPAGQAVPQMGVHWFDTQAPELRGLFGGGTPEPFTKTFIYGSWNGEITFYEPMVTRAYLLSRPDVVTPIRVAAQNPEPGWYPTSYRVSYDAQAKEYRVALTGLTARP
jgi:hypothetical protein